MNGIINNDRLNCRNYYIAQILWYVEDSMKSFDKNMTWEIYADLVDLSDFFNISYERMNEIFKPAFGR
jgi:hypothetical protein